MRYFFTIERYGLDKNGNTRHKIRVFKFIQSKEEPLINNYEPMSNAEMANIVGKWYKNGKISNLEVSDILRSIFVAFSSHEINYCVY